jgi:hypothetical protein
MASPVAAESGLFQNPFLDPYASLQGGTVSNVGNPLTRLQVPPINTLLYKTEEPRGRLGMVSVPEALSRTGLTTQQPMLVRNEAIGIELSLATMATPGQPPPITSGGVAPVPGGIQAIPTNMREAREVLSMITPQRTGSKSRVFGINDLKQIARNLNLPSTGNKDVLASRIRTAVIEYFNLPAQ